MGSRLMVHPTSVTNTVDRLAADGFVLRLPNPRDGRGILAEITESGRSTVERATKDLTTADFGLGALDENDRAAIFATLRTLRAEAGDFTD
jgi:DNA-binding MarR family transcriptional regulator